MSQVGTVHQRGNVIDIRIQPFTYVRNNCTSVLCFSSGVCREEKCLKAFVTSLWLWWTIVCPEENRIEKLFRTTSPGELLKELIKSQNNNKKNKKHAPKAQPGGDGVGSGGKNSQCPPMFLKVFIEGKLGLFHVTLMVRTRSSKWGLLGARVWLCMRNNSP